MLFSLLSSILCSLFDALSLSLFLSLHSEDPVYVVGDDNRLLAFESEPNQRSIALEPTLFDEHEEVTCHYNLVDTHVDICSIDVGAFSHSLTLLCFSFCMTSTLPSSVPICMLWQLPLFSLFPVLHSCALLSVLTILARVAPLVPLSRCSSPLPHFSFLLSFLLLCSVLYRLHALFSHSHLHCVSCLFSFCQVLARYTTHFDYEHPRRDFVRGCFSDISDDIVNFAVVNDAYAASVTDFWTYGCVRYVSDNLLLCAL